MARGTLGALLTASVIAGAMSAASGPIAGQAPASWTPPMTPWGDPDLRGIWTSIGVSGVPVERPDEFGEREFLTDEDFAQRQREGQQAGASVQEGQSTSVFGPAHWWEWHGRESRRTSLVTAPPNGQIPWKPDVLAEFREATEARRELRSWLDLDLWERCLTRGLPVAMIPSAYNAGYRIMQLPGYVVIYYEMFDIRFISLDGRPPLHSAIPQYFGSSRGRWEGNTLVVEVTNFSEKTRGTLKPNGGSGSGRQDTGFAGTGASLRVVERFTRIDADTIGYEGTVYDETAFTSPWTLSIPLRRDDDYEMFEYACHEGNYFITNLLTVTRFEEQAAAAAEESTR